MSLVAFNITNFRNFSNIELEPNNQCNLFYGKNGSGKTSLLEAIYYLILGRSFRSHLLRRIVKHGTDSFSLFGKIQQEGGLITVGLNRSVESGKQIKMAGKNISSNIEIARLSPIQLLTHNSYFLLSDGPKIRRQFMDWGMFHVKHSFLELWRKVDRVLEQRNIALRSKMPIDCITAWDKDLSLLGYELHLHRQEYIQNLTPVIQNVLQKLSCDFPINISYYAGWDTNLELLSALANNIKTDIAFGYTTAGPHRADLQIAVGKIPAKDILSRGQQKLLLYGLQIAQGILLEQLTGKRCIYLVDDLLAELDSHKCKLLAEILLSLPKTQVFATGLTHKDLTEVFSEEACNKTFFNVENS